MKRHFEENICLEYDNLIILDKCKPPPLPPPQYCYPGGLDNSSVNVQSVIAHACTHIISGLYVDSVAQKECNTFDQ